MFTRRTWKNLAPSLVILGLVVVGCSDDDGGNTNPVDTTRPRVVAVSPAPGAVDVDVNTSLVVTFSESIDLNTVSAETFGLSEYVEPAVPLPAKAAPGSSELTFTPAGPMAFSRLFRAVVDSSLADLAGNTLAADYSWTFTTEDSPDPPVEFPLAQGNAWLYQSESSASIWTASGSSTSNFEGLRVLFIERPATYEGLDCWLMRSYTLDQTLTVKSALVADYLYLAGDYYGLYQARPRYNSGHWMNLVRFLELSFDDSSFLIAGGPAHSDGSTLSTASVTVPAGTFETLRIAHDYSSTGPYAAEDIFETRREYFADGVGLVAATWDYSFDDNDPSGIDIYADGSAELLEPLNGPSLPYLTAELEPNDVPTGLQSQPWAPLAIVSGDIHITDSGTVLGDEDVDCKYAECILANIDGVQLLQDWYRIEVTVAAQYRLDLVFDYYDSQNDTWNDLDLYFFRELPDDAVGYIARADDVAGKPEWMILLHLEVGTYYAAIQAWDTPSESAGYTLAMRPQPVPVKRTVSADGDPAFLASQGKQTYR